MLVCLILWRYALLMLWVLVMGVWWGSNQIILRGPRKSRSCPGLKEPAPAHGCVQTFVRATEKYVCTPTQTLSSSFSHSLSHSHTLSNSLHHIKARAPSSLLPPSSLSPPFSLSCKHYPSNGSLEDTKTSSYLTPDTNLRALTVVYLGIKHTHKATWAPRKKNRQSGHAITHPPPPNTHTPSLLTPNTPLIIKTLFPYLPMHIHRYRCVCVCVCVCVYVLLSTLMYTQMYALANCACVCLCACLGHTEAIEG